MADISVIIEVLGSKEIERATKSMSSLEGRVDALRKSLKQGRISEDQFNQGLKEIRRSVDSQFPSWQKAKAAIDGHVKALDQLEKSKAVERHNKETERLKLQYNSTYRAAQSFKTQLRELGEAHSRGAISADRHEQQVRELKNEYRAFLKNGGGPMNQFGQIASKNTRVMKRFGAVGVQQLGYQIQDFAVQVQSGTSVLVALGQQGSQLLGIFGPAGAIAGMILAIGTGLAGAFLAARDASDETAKGVKNLDDRLKSLDSTVQDWIITKKAAAAGMTVEEFLGTQGLEGAQKDVEDARKRLKELKEEVEGPGRFGQTGVGLFLNYLGTRSADKDIAEAEKKLKEAQDTLNNIRKKAEYEYIQESSKLFREAQARIRKENGETLQQTIEDERRAKAERESYILEMVGVFRNAQVQMRQASKNTQAEIEQGYRNTRAAQATLSDKGLEETIDLFERTRDLKEELGGAAYEALRLSGVDMKSGVDAAAKAAARLAADLNISLAAALAMQNMASKEEQVMSQPVVPGPATDRFSVEDLLRMGYTEEYLKAIGKIRDRVGGGNGGSAEDPVEEFNRARDALASLVGQYDEGVAVAEKLRDAQTTVNEAIKAGVISQEQGQQAMQGYIQSLEQADNPIKKIGQTLKDSLGDAFMSIVDGSKSAGEAFRDMARAVLKQAFELLVIKPIISSIFGGGGGFLGGLFGGFFANGAAFNNGKVTAFADGGVVNQPTMFPMANGAGLMGEAGPEAVMPLKRGKNGKLGVQVEGGSQQPVVINQSFNFSANGDDSVKRIIAEEAPKIANLTQKQILDQRRRGGVMKSTFGG